MRLDAALMRDFRAAKIHTTGEYYRYVDLMAPDECKHLYPLFLLLEGEKQRETDILVGDMRIHHTCEPVGDDVNTSLKVDDWDRQRNFALLKEVVKHVAQGHYTTALAEKLRKVCEIENLHEAESILASLPPREVCGPIESWCLSALDRFCTAEFMRCNARRDLIARLKAEDEGT